MNAKTEKRKRNPSNQGNIGRSESPAVTTQSDGRSCAQGISREKYDEMVSAYFEIQTSGHVSKVCGVSLHTALKYINEGDLDRGMPPIRPRYLDAIKASHKKQDRVWADAQAESRELVRAEKALLTKALNSLAKDAVAQEAFIKQAKKDPKTLAETISKVVRDEAFLFDEPDGRQAVEASVIRREEAKEKILAAVRKDPALVELACSIEAEFDDAKAKDDAGDDKS